MITDVEWSVVNAPSGSTSEMTPADGLEPVLLLGLVGRYLLPATFELDGACRAESELDVRARPEEDIHIQLVWQTPRGPMKPTAVWEPAPISMCTTESRRGGDDPVLDCNATNPNPDRGRRGGGEDAPRLDQNDADDAGPENMSHDNPDEDRYGVGVHCDAARIHWPAAGVNPIDELWDRAPRCDC